MANPNLPAIIADVEKGLAGQQHRLNDAALSQAFYDYRGKRFMQVFLRDAETPFDYVQRPYRSAGFTRQIITILTQHLYSPGPSRTWDQPAPSRAAARSRNLGSGPHAVRSARKDKAA